MRISKPTKKTLPGILFRIFYDVVASAQMLYQLTGNLEGKIDQIEKISQKLAKYAQNRKRLGST